jgi:hypothetical protein
MCPFCISAVVSVAAGTVTTAGVASLFAFARRIGDPAREPTVPEPPRAASPGERG